MLASASFCFPLLATVLTFDASPLNMLAIVSLSFLSPNMLINIGGTITPTEFSATAAHRREAHRQRGREATANKNRLACCWLKANGPHSAEVGTRARPCQRHEYASKSFAPLQHMLERDCKRNCRNIKQTCDPRRARDQVTSAQPKPAKS